MVLGNAAHSLHPVAGQGFNLSLRDVAVLADVLGKAKTCGEDFSALDTLESYQQQQLADQQNTLLFSDNLPKLFGQSSSAVALGRNTGLLLMDLMPSLRSRFAHFGMGMATKEAGHGLIKRNANTMSSWWELAWWERPLPVFWRELTRSLRLP